jgi:HAE1 family hydrophobic/amphiphilic exporter-1
MIKGAISRPVTVSMFLLAVSLFGYISLDRLSLNLLPDIRIRRLRFRPSIRTPLPKK